MKILLTAGHGGKDPGNTANGRKESDIAINLRNIVASKLRAKGFVVETDGTKSENYSLVDVLKMKFTNRLCIEIHTNAGSPQAKGVETIGVKSQAKLCKAISQGIAKTIGSVVRKDQGFFDYEVWKAERFKATGKSASLGFVRNGGIIVEAFFQSNTQELKAYDDKAWLIAEAIAVAIEENV